MFGWRGRIGYISPSTITLPWEMNDLMPPGVSLICSNLRVSGYSDEQFGRAQQGIAEGVEYLAGEGAQVIILGGVPVAVREGYAREQERLAGLHERFGIPVRSAINAAVQGLKQLGVRRPVIATLYLEEMNRQISAYLAEAGLEPVAMTGRGAGSPSEASGMEAGVFYPTVRELVAASPQADSVLLCARIDLLSVARPLEEDLGLPVVYPGEAGLWWALRELGITARPAGSGRLLRT